MHSDTVHKKLSTETNRAFVSEDGIAFITCPYCNLTKQVSVADLIGKTSKVKVRCRCKQTFTFEFEFRQSHRKKTNLNGIYEVLSGKGGGRATIEDLSEHGLGFLTSGRNRVQVGQKIMINFSLDDQPQTMLKKRAVIRSVSDNRVGCEFTRGQATEKDFGFYLRT